ncbi:NmrA family NAD(P)-binding protein [Mucilaginibacter sp. CSA2-8R]|uniref:NmrA family NAD(P)-binding protein n=1 Tax=Mucilaginibacter sp. CSA2-8R TaxID=3141542 RepID=UPI00315D0699
MKNIILVAGATGNLGKQICKQLINCGAGVRAVVRAQSDPAKTKALQDIGVDVKVIDFNKPTDLLSACEDVSCIVSALAGLRDVIVTTQSQLLSAALQVGVPRFIPSDFCTDYTQLPEGVNRNFDLRKEFETLINDSKIKATSIFNGAFAYVLQYGIPLFDTRNKTIAYYEGKKDWKIDFTTVNDTAAYTAAAALDDSTPRHLHIASFQISAQDLADLSKSLYGEAFKLTDDGSLEQFLAVINKQRQANPEGEAELYPRWQQMQYLYSMFAVHHPHLDNARYLSLSWTSASDALQQKQA